MYFPNIFQEHKHYWNITLHNALRSIILSTYLHGVHTKKTWILQPEEIAFTRVSKKTEAVIIKTHSIATKKISTVILYLKKWILSLKSWCWKGRFSAVFMTFLLQFKKVSYKTYSKLYNLNSKKGIQISYFIP